MTTQLNQIKVNYKKKKIEYIKLDNWENIDIK